MRTVLVVLLLCLTAFVPLLVGQDDPNAGMFTPEQLDNLLAPIALYPDPLLAQVLLAATFPDQIDEAARFVQGNPDPGYIDSQPWDVSVKAVAHYPQVLQRMADQIDWTTSLGQAYVGQSSDVMTAVQRLRAQARSAGNLVTTPQQEVVYNAGYIEIWPAQPRFIYVPVYDPEVVYFRRGGTFISFGRGFALGVWLNHDCDWRGHRVYYHGWNDNRGWVMRSRPYVHVTNVYVNANYRNVVVNRTVVSRPVHYENLNRYRSVHRDVVYRDVRVGNRDHNRVVVDHNVDHNGNNRIVPHNVDVNNRGRIDTPRQEYKRPETYRPDTNRREIVHQEAARPAVNQPPIQTPPRQRVENSVVRGNPGRAEPHAASEHGQANRVQVERKAPPSKPSNPPAKHADRKDHGDHEK
jgi:hypothetical protein